MALLHHALPTYLHSDTSVLLHILLNHPQCLLAHVPLPATPEETSEESDNSSPQQMDVDAQGPDPDGTSDVIPEGAAQIRFLRRHNAISIVDDTNVTQNFML
jgi:hypothetical protein